MRLGVPLVDRRVRDDCSVTLARYCPEAVARDRARRRHVFSRGCEGDAVDIEHVDLRPRLGGLEGGCQDAAAAGEIEDPIYVLAGRDEGYVEFYDEYPAEVKDGKRPKN